MQRPTTMVMCWPSARDQPLQPITDDTTMSPNSTIPRTLRRATNGPVSSPATPPLHTSSSSARVCSQVSPSSPSILLCSLAAPSRVWHQCPGPDLGRADLVWRLWLWWRGRLGRWRERGLVTRACPRRGWLHRGSSVVALWLSLSCCCCWRCGSPGAASVTNTHVCTAMW